MTADLSGFPDTLTQQQEEALEALKAKLGASEVSEYVKQHPDGDDFLLRVLRATMKDKKKKRIFQVSEAFKRTKAIVDFMLKHKVTETPNVFEKFRKVYPRFTYKDKKAKKVLMLSRMGEFASRGKFSHFTEDEWCQSIGFEMENVQQAMREMVEEDGADKKGYYAITCAKGLSLGILKQKKATIFLGNISGENYPEMIDKVFIINAPWIFEKAFGVIKPLLDPQTVSKFHISSGIPKFLKESLDLSKLPKEFGGNAEVKVPYPLDCKRYDPELISYEKRVE